MKTENRFNLLDEPWIPVLGTGLVSLNKVFTDKKLRALVGNAVQKIALLKFLLAICQAAATPANKDEWEKMGPNGMAKKVLVYLKEQREKFWLYGKAPFLQMPDIPKAKAKAKAKAKDKAKDKDKIQSFGAVLPDIATGNTTVLNQSQVAHPLSDAEKALLLVQLMGFALAGKKVDNSIVLTEGYTGKTSSGKPGPSLGKGGHLHSFLIGDNLLQTIWLNVFTMDEIDSIKIFPKGLGVAPWESMPKGEDCKIAKDLRDSLMGRLVPVCRFVLLTKDGLHYTEGIAHPGHTEGKFDPSMTVDKSGKKLKTICCDPEKRPWRNLPALLSFLEGQRVFECHQVRYGIEKARSVKGISTIGIWSGGLCVSGTSGEQFVSGRNDYIESETRLASNVLGEPWFAALKLAMEAVDQVSRIVYARVFGYYKAQHLDAKGQAGQASGLFWQLCERRFQDLIDACADETDEKIKSLRPVFGDICDKVFNSFCPRETARQISAWAENRPQIGWYLKGESVSEKKASKKRKET